MSHPLATTKPTKGEPRRTRRVSRHSAMQSYKSSISFFVSLTGFFFVLRGYLVLYRAQMIFRRSTSIHVISKKRKRLRNLMPFVTCLKAIERVSPYKFVGKQFNLVNNVPLLPEFKNTTNTSLRGVPPRRADEAISIFNNESKHYIIFMP